MGQLPVVVVLVGAPPAALHVGSAPLSECLGQRRGARILAAGYDDTHGFLRVVACRGYLIIVEWGRCTAQRAQDQFILVIRRESSFGASTRMQV